MKKFSYYVQLFFLTPFWFLGCSVNKKSWAEFKSGLIEHECKFTGKIENKRGYYYRSCGHLGCNMVNFCDMNGNIENWK